MRFDNEPKFAFHITCVRSQALASNTTRFSTIKYYNNREGFLSPSGTQKQSPFSFENGITKDGLIIGLIEFLSQWLQIELYSEKFYAVFNNKLQISLHEQSKQKLPPKLTCCSSSSRQQQSRLSSCLSQPAFFQSPPDRIGFSLRSIISALQNYFPFSTCCWSPEGRQLPRFTDQIVYLIPKNSISFI